MSQQTSMYRHRTTNVVSFRDKGQCVELVEQVLCVNGLNCVHFRSIYTNSRLWDIKCGILSVGNCRHSEKSLNFPLLLFTFKEHRLVSQASTLVFMHTCKQIKVRQGSQDGQLISKKKVEPP